MSQDHPHQLTVLGEVYVGGRMQPCLVVVDLAEFDHLSAFAAREAIRHRLREAFFETIGNTHIKHVDTIDAMLAERRVK